MLEAKADTSGWAKERALRIILDPTFGLPAGKSLYRVAKDADVSYSWVHAIWRDLVHAGAFDEPPQNGRLKEPRLAFDYWLKHRIRRHYADYHVSDPLGFLKSLEHDRDLDYVATTYLAENLVQGHLFPRRYDLYIRPAQAAAWHKALTSRGFAIDSREPEKGTVRIMAADDSLPDEIARMQPASLRPETPIRGIYVVRMPLLIADLLEEGGTCVEAARALMERTYA